MTAGRVVLSAPLVPEHAAGPAVHVTALARAMLQERPGLTLVARHATLRGALPNRRSAARIDPRVRARTVPAPTSVLRALEGAVRLPRERWLLGRYDVFHQLHTDFDPAVPDARLVVTLHDTVALRWPEEEGAMWTHAGRLLRRAAAVITVSKFSRDAICEHFSVDPDRVHVVPNGVDHDRFTPGDHRTAHPAVRSLTGPGRYVLFVGGSTPRKNLPTLLEAFAAVREQHPGLHLVLAGPVAQAEQRLRAAAPASLPPEALRFAGYVPDGLLPDLYRAACALVLPSLHEGFGLPVAEAMACGTPVVTSATTALPEVAGVAAVLIDPSSAHALARGILDVLSEGPARAAHRREAGIAQAATFRWDEAARRVLAVYDGL